MIFDSLIALVFLYITRKCYGKLKAIRALLDQLRVITIYNVSEAIKHLSISKKKFAIIKGILKPKYLLNGENNILSAIDVKDLGQLSLLNLLKRRKWTQILSKAYWQSPASTKNMQFLITDLHDSTPLEFKCTSDAHLSGALTEMLTMTVEATLPKNLLVRGFTRILKFFESISPLNRFFHIISSGEQLISYAIPDGQYALIIGHMAVDEDKKLVLTGPVYVSKQKSFLVQCIKYIRKQYEILIFLSALILLIFLFRIVRKLYYSLKEVPRRLQRFDPKRTPEEDQKCNCIICFQNVRSIALKPCLHYALCESCYDHLRTPYCPYCKSPITGIIQIIKQ